MPHVPIFLIVTLLFLGTIPTSVAKDDAVQAQAVADAASDAKNYNATPWATVGVLSAPASACLFLLGCIYAVDIIGPIVRDRAGIGVCLGILPTGVVLSSGAVKVSPPAEHLMGKSPEYVSVYVKTYTEKVKRKRQKYAIIGSAAGYLITGAFTVWFISDYDPWLSF